MADESTMLESERLAREAMDAKTRADRHRLADRALAAHEREQRAAQRLEEHNGRPLSPMARAALDAAKAAVKRAKGLTS